MKKSKNKGKILMITDTWLPQVNGVVSALQKTAALLEEDGYHVVMIHPGLFKTVPLLLYPEIRLAVFPKRRLGEIIRKEKPDYIHINNEGPLGLAARAYCLKHKLSFTTTFHTHFPLYIPYYTPVGRKTLTRVAYSYLRWFHNAGARTLAASKSLQKDLLEHGFKHVELCPLGVDLWLFKRNKNVPSPFKSPVFVYFGRIAKEKGLEEFLQAELSGTKVMIGDGPARSSLEKKFGKKAVFVGYKKGQELVDLLSIADVFVLPSVTETFGLVVVEALACGLPVAAHNVLGPKDVVVHGVHGFLDEDLGRAARAALKLPREKMRERALDFSWEKSAKIFADMLVPLSTGPNSAA